MKTRMMLFCVAISLFMIIGCSNAPKEPKEYIHTQAKFKITAPGKWYLDVEDAESFTFRRGKTRLIEVGSYSIPATTSELDNLSGEELSQALEDAALGGLSEYCKAVQLTGYRVDTRNRITWAGLPAYRIKVFGFAATIYETVEIDLLVTLDSRKSLMYIFISQIAKSEYDEAAEDIEKTIASFKTI